MIHLERFPDPVPATVFPSKIIDAAGSSGAGKAMNFASLGWDVTFWTPVGEDEAGDRAVAEVEVTRLGHWSRERHRQVLRSLLPVSRRPEPTEVIRCTDA